MSNVLICLLIPRERDAATATTKITTYNNLISLCSIVEWIVSENEVFSMKVLLLLLIGPFDSSLWWSRYKEMSVVGYSSIYEDVMCGLMFAKGLYFIGLNFIVPVAALLLNI